MGLEQKSAKTFDSYLSCLAFFSGIQRLLICASAKQKQQIIKMQMLWNVFQVSAVELERARVQLISANEIIECG